MAEFWRLMEEEVGLTSSSDGEQRARGLQTRMVRALKSYTLARSAWEYLVVPALFSVPRCFAISVKSQGTYLPMPYPVRKGQQVYVDSPSEVITDLPPELVGEGLSLMGGGATRVAGVLLTGIATHSGDRNLRNDSNFLTFSVDRDAVVRTFKL